MKISLMLVLLMLTLSGHSENAVELKLADGRPVLGSIVKSFAEVLRIKRSPDGVLVDIPWTDIDRELAWRLLSPLIIRREDEPEKRRVTLNLIEQIPLSPEVTLRPSVVMIGPYRQKDGVVLSFDRTANAWGWQRFHPVVITVDGKRFEWEGAYDGDNVGSGVSECVSIRITMEEMNVICRGQTVAIKVGAYAFSLQGNRMIKVGALLSAWRVMAAVK
jgi:hypothetical protein